MKEQIHTIPVNEAFDSQDECPFCFSERTAEQRVIRYVAGNGASYMEPDVRLATDRTGFCRHHMKKLYDYGNALGNALMLQTHLAGIIEEFRYEKDNFQAPAKKSLFSRKKVQEEESYHQRLRQKVDSCYICEKIDYNTERYMATFFMLLKEPEFRTKVENSRGFCMHHFRMLLEEVEQSLPNGQREWFRETIPALMQENLLRVKGDLDRFVLKHDYRNGDLPWENARDAVSRGMQKIRGGHPADPVFRNSDFGIKK